MKSEKELTPIQRFLESSEEEQKRFVRMISSDTFNLKARVHVERRRRQYAESISAGDLDTAVVCNHLKDREDDFLEEHKNTLHDLPEWLLRAEAQDMIIEIIYEEFVDKGLIKDEH